MKSIKLIFILLLLTIRSLSQEFQADTVKPFSPYFFPPETRTYIYSQLDKVNKNDTVRIEFKRAEGELRYFRFRGADFACINDSVYLLNSEWGKKIVFYWLTRKSSSLFYEHELPMYNLGIVAEPLGTVKIQNKLYLNCIKFKAQTADTESASEIVAAGVGLISAGENELIEIIDGK